MHRNDCRVTPSKLVEIQGKPIHLRDYDVNDDPPKLVRYLYDQAKTEAEINELGQDLKAWLEGPQTRAIFVAESNQELIASLMVEGCLGPTPDDKFTLFSVVTAPHMRGTGISQALFAFATEWVRSCGARMLLVETWANNQPARRFYEKMGFIQYGCLPQGLKNREGEGYVDEIFYYRPIQ